MPRQLVAPGRRAGHGRLSATGRLLSRDECPATRSGVCHPRAGELSIVGQELNSKEIGLGCVNPRTDEAESPDGIIARAKEAMEWWRPEQIFLNPDCGFGCFANRCVNEEMIAAAKLRSMVQAAQRLREMS